MQRLTGFYVRLAVLVIILSISTVTAQQVIVPPDSIWGMDWNPTNDRLAIGRFNGLVQIINVVNGQITQTLQSTDTSQILAVDWSSNGAYIAASNVNKSVLIWDANTGQLLHTLIGQNTDYVVGLAWNSSNTLLASISQFDGRLQIWNTNGQIVLNQQYGPFQAIDWFNTKIVLATGTGASQIDSSTGQFVKDISIQSSEIISVKWSPTGDRIVTGNMGGDVEVWDANTNQRIRQFQGHTLPVVAVSWYADGTKIASASYDGTVKIWDLSTEQIVDTLQSSDSVLNVALSPNGQRIAYAGASAATGTLATVMDAPQIPSKSGTGLRGQYFDNADFTALKRYQIDSTVNIVPPNTTLPVVIPLSIRWVGRVESLYSEAYTFFVNSSRRERLWVNGQLVLSDWSNPTGESSGTITLAAGVRYDVLLEYSDEFGPNAQIKLEWQSARQARQIIPASQLYPPEGQMAFNGRTGSTGEIFIRNPDGTGEINVSNHAADDNSPTWSPDGTRLAFVSTRSGNQDIWLVNADGSGLRQLTNHSSFDREIAWSSDGTKIAFSSGRTGGGDIYVISVAGTGIPSATRFTRSTLNEYNPVWAPNGGGIAYVVDTGTSTGADLYWRLATAAGAPVGNPIRLTNRNGTDTAPFFSPDGSKIVFRAPVSGVDQIWVVNLVGQGAPSIIGPLTTQGNNYFQSWSPDSTRILFQSTRDGNPEIYSMNADGSSQTRLTNNSVSEAYAVWSADARQIAFQRGNDLWLMNADGSNQRNVSNTPNRTELEIVWWQVKQS
ncbi:MAG: PD40 domain-containing protein [Anaerolineae bacterium]|nr:PD40 domain-containing protein [Anaerolineae bacterium]